MAVEPDRSQLRLPAQGGATRKPSAKQARRRTLARTCQLPARVALRLGGRGVYGVGQARERTSRAAAGPTEAAPHAWRPAGLRAHLWMVGWYPWALKRLVTKYNDVDRGVDRLARVLVCRGASMMMCALGGWCACGVECAVCGWAIVLILRGGWAKKAGLGRRSHLQLKRRLKLELKGVDLRSVERRRQGDDEW